MHIETFNRYGETMMTPACGSKALPWNRTINAPFGLGRRICKRCKKVAA